jgi:iron complex transport system substrate-binding protein
MKQIIILILFVFCCSGQNNDNRNELQNKDNRKIPQRIVSLAPAITEDLYLLGAGDSIVADTYYCNRPEAAKKKRKIGNLMNFNIEDILALKPDLILCTSLANRNKINKLRQLNADVMEFPPPADFNEICRNFLLLSQAIGKEKKAKETLAGVKSQVENIKKATGDIVKKKVFIQIGSKPLIGVNRDYHINDLIRFSGGINIYEKSELNLFSRESVIRSDPDIIIIASMGIASDEEKKTWEKFYNMNAVKNKNIFIVDADVFCNFALNSFIEALKISVSVIHPELKLNY